MSDISSDAASTGASDDPDQSATGASGRGLLTRLFGSRSASDAASETPDLRHANGAHALPGLGNLRRLRVADVAIPKAEIVAVPNTIDHADLIEVFRKSGFSRLPVFNETLDKPMGLLLLKDLVLRDGFDLKGDAPLDPLLRPLMYVPSSMSLLVLFQKMQAERMHMALVIDEYGGVDGLLTIEDLLEQVVGEISDEHDTEDDALWQRAEDGSWLIQARASLDDLRTAIGVDLTEGLEDEDVDTLGGVVFVLLGRVPARGEVIAHPAGPEIQVLDADPRRVKRLRLRPEGPSAPPAE